MEVPVGQNAQRVWILDLVKKYQQEENGQWDCKDKGPTILLECTNKQDGEVSYHMIAYSSYKSALVKEYQNKSAWKRVILPRFT